MSRLVIPITGKILWATGDVRHWADIQLLLQDDFGNWKAPEVFRVDTSTDVTTFPAFRARQLGLPIPQSGNPGVTHTQTGLAVRSGYLRFRIRGMDATEYGISCFFLGNPSTRPDPNQPATLPRKLLQPLGLLDQLRFVFDKDPNDGTAHGTLTVEKKRP